jgi:hypothetical protein
MTKVTTGISLALLLLTIPTSMVIAVIASQNEAFAQNNESSSSSLYNVIKDIVVPLVTFVGGLVGGYFLNARTSWKSRAFDDANAKWQAYNRVIFDIRYMLHNPRFLHGTETEDEFRETVRDVKQIMIDYLQDRKEEYIKFRHDVPKAAAQDCEKRKEFAENGKKFLNSLIEVHNQEVVPNFNRLSKTKNKISEETKETGKLECVTNSSTGDIALEWK